MIIWEIKMRIQVELPEERVTELKTLMEKVGIETYKELFNWSITLLNWSVKQTEEGRIIESVKDGERTKELVMPALEHLKRHLTKGHSKE
jgi:hypothetical protein